MSDVGRTARNRNGDLERRAMPMLRGVLTGGDGLVDRGTLVLDPRCHLTPWSK